MAGSVLQPVQSTFRAVAETVVAEAASLRPQEWRELQDVVEEALAMRPEKMRQQLVLLLRAIEYLPLARYLRPFSRLDTKRRASFLASLQSSPRLAIRRGFWGLRTLIFLGYYTRDDVQASLGYRPHANGWSARRTTSETRAAVSAELVQHEAVNGAEPMKDETQLSSES
ncbi:MAG: hypothetical protein ABIT38_06590 [Gemmatimonadaceae bacterium]